MSVSFFSRRMDSCCTGEEEKEGFGSLDSVFSTSVCAYVSRCISVCLRRCETKPWACGETHEKQRLIKTAGKLGESMETVISLVSRLSIQDNSFQDQLKKGLQEINSVKERGP